MERLNRDIAMLEQLMGVIADDIYSSLGDATYVWIEDEKVQL